MTAVFVFIRHIDDDTFPVLDFHLKEFSLRKSLVVAPFFASFFGWGKKEEEVKLKKMKEGKTQKI
ncbi:MAG TPA: hypothetical protein DEG09_12225 [Marinilabiliaceae bacterium]|nr:hypothetical protein [Marinilabiliaceae bacterium]HBX89366.1 hypothetical protein [Marinilabiliaceae bacterium]